jgi:hypothetical protein
MSGWLKEYFSDFSKVCETAYALERQEYWGSFL